MSQITSIKSTSQCCYRAALNKSAGYCDECGKPIIRCAAFSECGGLLSDEGHCSVCISPQLILKAGNIQDVKVGGSAVVSFELLNTANVERPLILKGFWMRLARGEWQPVSLTWDRLEAGSSAPLSVIVDQLDKPGTHEVEVMIAVASRYRWREEVQASVAQILIKVEEPQPISIGSGPITQSGNGTVYAPMRVTIEAKNPSGSGTTESQPMTLTRASVLERQFSLRGYVDDDGRTYSVPRRTAFEWKGLAKGTAPPEGPIVTEDSQLKVGRERSVAQGGGNDVRLLVSNPDGSVDEANSKAISREHFGLFIENDRLMLHVRSNGGVWLDGAVIQRGESQQITNGSVLSPVPSSPKRLAIRFDFDIEHDRVVRIVATQNS